MAKVEKTAPVKKKKRSGRKTKKVIAWVIQIALVLTLAAGVAFGYFGTVIMQDSSMIPTLRPNDHIRINRVSYFFDSPERGDIIAFYKSESKTASIQIKRIIGVPGDTVQIKEGLVLINGETYISDDEFSKINNAGLAEKPVKLGKGEFFVLGDNRNSSEDSRFIDMGNIKEESIIGKVWVVTSPWSRFGFL